MSAESSVVSIATMLLKQIKEDAGESKTQTFTDLAECLGNQPGMSWSHLLNVASDRGKLSETGAARILMQVSSDFCVRFKNRHNDDKFVSVDSDQSHDEDDGDDEKDKEDESENDESGETDGENGEDTDRHEQEEQEDQEGQEGQEGEEENGEEAHNPGPGEPAEFYEENNIEEMRSPRRRSGTTVAKSQKRAKNEEVPWCPIDQESDKHDEGDALIGAGHLEVDAPYNYPTTDGTSFFILILCVAAALHVVFPETLLASKLVSFS